MMRVVPSLRIAEPGMHPLDYHILDFLHAKATKAAKTVQFYDLALRLYAQHVGRHWPPTDSSINSFLASAKRRGCADGTVHAYYRTLRAWCNWLYRREKLAENPIELVEEPPKSKRLPRAPRAVHLGRLFVALESAARLGKWNHIRDLALFNFMYETGVRVGEAITLQMEDLAVPFCVAAIRNTKTDEDRVVVYNHATAEDLHRWVQVREQLCPPPDLTNVFISHHCTYHGTGPLTISGVRQALQRWCRRARIPFIAPHAFRHAYAIHALRSGADILDVKSQMGHRNLITTQRYTLAISAGRRQRHARHSPRTNLPKITQDEQADSKPLISDQALRSPDKVVL